MTTARSRTTSAVDKQSWAKKPPSELRGLSQHVFPLPDDLFASVLLFVDTTDLLKFSTVSKACRGMFASGTHAARHLQRLLMEVHATKDQLELVSRLAGGNVLPCQPSFVQREAMAQKQRNCLNIGHKGAEGHIKGNTLPSFLEAIKLGVDVIEFDVLTCKDGTVVCHHDPMIEETGQWIENMNIEQVLAHHPKHCTLEQMLQAKGIVESEVELYFDLKHNNIVRPVMKLIQRAILEWGWDASRIIVATFKQMELLEINAFRRAYPELAEIRTACILDCVPLTLAKDFQELGCCAISVGKFCVSPDLVEDARRRGLQVWCWTVNNQHHVEQLMGMGVDGVCTDFPEMVHLAREKLAARNAAATVTQKGAADFYADPVNHGQESHALLKMVYNNLGDARQKAVAAILEARLACQAYAKVHAIQAMVDQEEGATLKMAELSTVLQQAESQATTLLQPVVFSAESFKWAVTLIQTPEGREIFRRVAQTMGNQTDPMAADARSPRMPRLLGFERRWLANMACQAMDSGAVGVVG